MKNNSREGGFPELKQRIIYEKANIYGNNAFEAEPELLEPPKHKHAAGDRPFLFRIRNLFPGGVQDLGRGKEYGRGNRKDGPSAFAHGERRVEFVYLYGDTVDIKVLKHQPFDASVITGRFHFTGDR